MSEKAQHGRNCGCRDCAALVSVVRAAPVMRCDRAGCTAEAPAFTAAEGWSTKHGVHLCFVHAYPSRGEP